MPLPERFDTDKEEHGYVDAYLDIAEHLQFVGNVCELGVLKGGSLAMWQTLFLGSVIVGVDRDEGATWPAGTHRIISEQDAPELPERLRATLHELGVHQEFALIVDDASHDGQMTSTTFNNLWSLVQPGGFYCIEDWHVGLPSQRALGYDQTMLLLAQRLLRLLDPAHNDPHAPQSHAVESITYQRGLIIIQKRA